MNWACPPSRSKGITDSRATSAATAEPWSLRIIWRQRSSAAAEGRPATTNRNGGLDVLDATGTVAVDARVVDDKDLVTASGVTSGLDLGLHLLDREIGPRVALAVEKLFEYERRGIVWRAEDLEPTPL